MEDARWRLSAGFLQRVVFDQNIVTASAVSSTALGSILIFASCGLYRSPVFSELHIILGLVARAVTTHGRSKKHYRYCCTAAGTPYRSLCRTVKPTGRTDADSTISEFRCCSLRGNPNPVYSQSHLRSLALTCGLINPGRS